MQGCKLHNLNHPFLKLRSNILEWVRKDLNTFLSLVTPKLYCLDVTKQILSWFWGDVLGQEIPNLVYSNRVYKKVQQTFTCYCSKNTNCIKLYCTKHESLYSILWSYTYVRGKKYWYDVIHLSVSSWVASNALLHV